MFLTKTVNNKKLLFTEAFDASKAEKELLERSWTGKYPYLHLIHCLVEDHGIKYEFLHRHDIDTTRMTIEKPKLSGQAPKDLLGTNCQQMERPNV